ncbi:MAG: hypothetical protein PHY80_03100 [Rickettsiales bacterium]|nr:hypothetical protein [Rickettsiales bacterium]
MEEKKVITELEINNKKKYNIKNVKPFLSIFVILLVIIIAYYFVWRNITIKMKDVIVESLKDFKYESISASGFPFSKKISINKIDFINNTPLATQNYVSIDKLTISSFIFSRTLDIKLKDIKTINPTDNSIFTLNYNEEPQITISFYPDRTLESFNYSDIGYRVINNNETLYTASKSLISVESTKTDGTTDYSIVGDLQNMQNISVLDKKEQISDKIEPEIYNMKFNLSTSLTLKEGKLDSSVIKIISVNLAGNKDTNISLSGEIIKSPDDPYSYGALTLKLANYEKFLESYKKDFIEALTIEGQANQKIENIQVTEYKSMINKLFDITKTIVAKNSETKNGVGVLTLERKKNASDYTVNGDSLINIIQILIKK